MHRFIACGAVFLAAVCSVGCSSVEAPDYDTDPRVVELRASTSEPLDFGVTVGLPVIAAAQEVEGRHATDVDARDLQRMLVELITTEGLFRSAAPASDADGAAQLREGWERLDDLVLQLSVDRADVTYEGVNGWFYPNLFVWFYAWVPSWWIADETYAVSLEVTARLVSVHSGREVFRKTYRPTVAHELDDFDRGWGLFATVLPGSLDSEDWRSVGTMLLPSALHELKVELFRDLRNELPSVVAAPKFQTDMAKTLVLGVGLTQQGSYRVHNLRFAENDARTVAGALQERLGLPDKNVQLVLNAQATGEGIRGAVKDFLAGRSRAGDTLVLYIAGYGTVLPDGRPAVVPYDFDPKRAAATALPLDDLRRLLDASPASTVMVLDVGWDAPAEGRGLRGIEEVERGAADAAAFDALGGPRRLVVFAGGPQDGAFELPQAGHGMLTHYLLEGLAGKADADTDGVVSAVEAAQYAIQGAERQAGLEGHAQTPRMAGAAPGTVLTAGGAGEGR
ncbi:MAG: caspase family protein [Planctomycetota bacterium]|jgi:hypothetical protein